jgi:hypothetical protein
MFMIPFNPDQAGRHEHNVTIRTTWPTVLRRLMLSGLAAAIVSLGLASATADEAVRTTGGI